MAFGITEDVQFDFEGSLQLARKLWEFSEEFDSALGERLELRDIALADWLGAFGTQFAGRMANEQQDRASLVAALKENATLWADAWRDATNEQARREYARMVDQMKADRSIAAKIGDAFTGFDYPPEPIPVTSPAGPGFVPTCGVG